MYAQTVGGTRYRFPGSARFWRAPRRARSGDVLAGVAAAQHGGARGGADGAGRSAAADLPHRSRDSLRDRRSHAADHRRA